LVLATVPIAWGTYTPVVKYIYDVLDPPIPGIIFSGIYYTIAAVTLGLLSTLSSSETTTNTTNNTTIKAGIELGLYLFIGNLLQLIGLKTIPAYRAAFLVQLTTILVPFGESLLKQTKLSNTTYGACGLAFVGVLLMGGVNFSSTSIDIAFNQGDVCIVLAAVSYTMHVLRLDTYSKQINNPIELASSKATVEASLSGLAIVVLLATGTTETMWSDASLEVSNYLNTLDGSALPSPAAVGACLWTGWITCAYTIYAQSYGQLYVSPTNANLLYTTQPIASSIFAYLLLNETFQLNDYIGATMIVAACLLSASSAVSTSTSTSSSSTDS